MKRLNYQRRPNQLMSLHRKFFAGLFVAVLGGGAAALAADATGAAEFRKDVRPILQNFCFDCHADGAKKGSVAFDEFKTDQAMLDDRELWLHVLKNLRAGLMPPAKRDQPTKGQKEIVEHWIK